MDCSRTIRDEQNGAGSNFSVTIPMQIDDMIL